MQMPPPPGGVGFCGSIPRAWVCLKRGGAALSGGQLKWRFSFEFPFKTAKQEGYLQERHPFGSQNRIGPPLTRPQVCYKREAFPSDGFVRNLRWL